MVFSLVLGFLGAFIISQWGLKFKFIDIPVIRSSHSKVTPKGGGIGILLSFIIVSVYQNVSLLINIPVLILSIVNLIGDRNEIRPLIRLCMQFFAVIAILMPIFPSDLIDSLVKDSNYSTSLNFIIFIGLSVFIVGTANFYNFMDGINGIAGITAIVAFSFLGFVAYQKSVTDISVIAICISFSCIGFLPWNIPNARVFMGDVGSVLLGLVYAVFVVQLSENMTDFICLTGFLLLFYLDELTTMIERLRTGESLIKPHRRHLYQILANEGGISHWKISIGFGLLQTLICSLLLMFHSQGTIPLIILILFSAICFVFFSNIKKSTLIQ